MANRKATMTDLRVIIREFAKGTPLREIERKLGLSRTSIRTYRERAEQSGRTMLELQSLEDAELHVIYTMEQAWSEWQGFCAKGHTLHKEAVQGEERCGRQRPERGRAYGATP